MLEPDEIAVIDKERAKGKLPTEIEAALKRVGHPDPKGAMDHYMNTPLPDGRARGQVNPGDPAERATDGP